MKKTFWHLGFIWLLIFYIGFIQKVYAQNPATPQAEILPFPHIIINEVSFKNSEHDFIKLLIVDDQNNGDGNSINGLQIEDDSTFFEINEDIEIQTNDLITIYFKSEIENVENTDFFIIKSGLTGTTEQVILKHNNEIIDAVCWANDSPTSSEITDFEELYSNNQWLNDDIHSCIYSTEIENNKSIVRKNEIDTNSKNDWEVFVEEIPEEPTEELPEEIIAEDVPEEVPEIIVETEVIETIIEEDKNICTENIFINEFLPNPKGKDTNNEWIELINKNNENCNLEGWIIDDIEGGSKPYTIEDQEIRAKGLVILPSWITKVNLNNSNEEVRLFSPEEKVIDHIKYEKSFENQSFARNENNEFVWTPLLTPMLFNLFEEEIIEEEIAENTTKKSTKKKTSTKKYIENGTKSDKIMISELFPNPKGKDSGLEWIELYNNSEEDVYLGNWKITEGTDGKKSYVFENEKFEAQSYLVLSDKDLGFSIKNTNALFQLLDFENTVIDSVTYESSEEEQSYAKIQIIDEDEESSEWNWTKETTEGEENPSYYLFTGTIVDFDAIEGKLTLELTTKEEKIITVIEGGDQLLESIFTKGTILKITTSQSEESHIMESYEIISQAEPEEDEQENNNVFYILLSALMLLGYIGFKIIKKFGILKIM